MKMRKHRRRQAIRSYSAQRAYEVFTSAVDLFRHIWKVDRALKRWG